MKYRETKYNHEERLRILKEIDSGGITLRDAARKYEMSPSGISYWRIHFGMRKPWGKRERESLLNEPKEPKTVQERALAKELEELKLKLAELYIENDFLKKARSYADREKKHTSSIITDLNVSKFKKPAR
jgi:transposase-like protein